MSPRLLGFAAVLLLGVPLIAATSPTAAASYAKLPMQFEPNRGQAPPDTRFVSRGRGYALFLTDTGAVFNARHSEKTFTVRMQMRGANPRPRTEALDALPGVSNYFVGKDSRQWRTNISTFQRVMYHDAWRGVDMVYHGNQRQLEYDFVVHPGGNPDIIRLRFDGPEDLRVAEDGDLVMRTSAG